MANTNTGIEWADCTWNVCIGCAKVAQGCKHCYAERMAKRLARMGQDHYAAVVNDTGWNGRAVTVPEALSKPLRWKKPRRIFVNSMSDLYHDDVPFEFIAAVKGVQAATPQHTYIELTKRPKRMREFMKWLEANASTANVVVGHAAIVYAQRAAAVAGRDLYLRGFNTMSKHALGTWPLPNVIHGYSASTQADLDAGMPDLMQVPSALHMLSAEPLLGDLDLGPALEGLDWVVVGGESGPGARPCNVAWIRAIVEQCRSADVACFVKQLGSRPAFDGMRYESTQREWGAEFRCKDPKGGDPAEWPEDLRVRQFPEVMEAGKLKCKDAGQRFRGGLI